MLFSLLFALPCLFTPTFSAVMKRASFAGLASSAGLNAVSFPLQRTLDSGAYILNVSFTDSGDYVLPMQIDLSSPNSWVNTPSTYCSRNGDLEGGGYCGVTAPESSCLDTPLEITVYNISDGSEILGKHYPTDLALGPIQIQYQDLIYADQTGVATNDVSAGVLGLAYPEIFENSPINTLSPSPTTSAFSSATSTSDSSPDDIFLLANLFHQNDDISPTYIRPVVSLAISRDTSGSNDAGSITLGGYPDINNSNINASVAAIFPMVISNYSGADQLYSDISMQYAIPVEALTIGNTTIALSRSNTSQPFFLSTGDTSISLPPALAAYVNSQFNPPAFLRSDNSTYGVYCNATAPAFALQIGSRIASLTFDINPVDLKRHISQSLCVSMITAGSGGRYVLGDLFLRNALVVLDFRSTTMELGPRPYYVS